jgi:putative ABC transport system permease protein
MRTIVQDLRFAFRTLRRRPAFAAVAIITIALGIGAATSIYSVVDGVLLRPLPFPDASRIVAVLKTYPSWRKDPLLSPRWDHGSISAPEYRDLREGSKSFSDVAIWGTSQMTLSGRESAERLHVTLASASLLSVLGVQPILGRNFLPSEEVLNGPPVTLISYEAWRSRLGSDGSVLGRTVMLDDKAYAIVGVLPPKLTLGRGDPPTELWIPAMQDSGTLERGVHSFTAIARLRAGVQEDRAAAEAARLIADPESKEPEGARLTEWQTDQTREVRAPLLVLLAAAGLLLLVACVNVATLMLGEASSREHEMAARLALGAGRPRLIRQLLTESTALAGVASVVGVGVAWWGTRVLVALAPASIPGLSDVRMDVRVLVFAVIASMVTGMLFGLAPAIIVSRTRPAFLLRAGAGQSGRHRGALQRGMIAAELALSVILLIGAGLLGRSLRNLTSVNPGFRADHLLVARIALPPVPNDDGTRLRAIQQEFQERLANLPGVRGVSAAASLAFGGGVTTVGFDIEGRAKSSDVRPNAQWRTVVPGFFELMEIPLLAGRRLTPEDRAGALPVVVITESMARRDFPLESPVGKRIRTQGSVWTVVGVVGDTKFRKLSTADEVAMYAPTEQFYPGGLYFFVRTQGEPTTMSAPIRRAAQQLHPRIAVTRLEPMSDLIARSYGEERYRTLLISIFGALAVVLAAVGMYGVTARAVGRRIREVGIRIALGATSWSVVRLILTYTLVGVSIGVGVGMLGSLAATRALAPYLFGIGVTDPVTYAGIALLLAVVSMVATWLPARRAARVDPAVVLRTE